MHLLPGYEIFSLLPCGKTADNRRTALYRNFFIMTKHHKGTDSARKIGSGIAYCNIFGTGGDYFSVVILIVLAAIRAFAQTPPELYGIWRGNDCCIFFGDDLIAVDDGEGDIWVLLEGIDLVSRYRRVKVDVLAVVDVAEGDGVGERLVAREGEYARRAVQEHCLCLLVGQLLNGAPHFVKHDSASLPKNGGIQMDSSVHSQ